MEISRELIKKYANGACNAEERKAVEDWLALDEGYDNDQYKELFESRKDSIREKLDMQLWPNQTKFWRYTKKALRYSAAACILVATFLGGRVSASSASSNPAPPAIYKTGLHISGVSGAYDKLDGNHFKIRFNGTLRLYNNSGQKQKLLVGDSTFILTPGISYFLSGNTKKADLSDYIAHDEFLDESDIKPSDFSIYRLD